MHKLTFDPAHTDYRGTITDLIEGPIDAITRVISLKGSVRGNHVHLETTQWTFVVSGKLYVQTNDTGLIVLPGEMIVNNPGEPHAWKALEDTDCLVFVQGPRAGENYEQDTYRLQDPLIQAAA